MELDTIVCGDCLDVMADMSSGCVDLVVTDPLFTLPVTTAASRKRIRNLGDFSASSLQMSLVFDELKRITKPTSRLFIFCDSIFYPVLFAVTYQSWQPQLLVWDKGRIGFGTDFRRQFELILYLKGQNTPSLNRSNNRADILKCRPVPPNERLIEAQKPVALLLNFLDGVPGNLIFDPFIGSGTTAVAALKLGRHFYGCDINPEYIELANKCIEKARLEMAQMKLL